MSETAQQQPADAALISSRPPHNGRLYIETVGCQMNMLDSELVVAALRREGYLLADNPKDADTVLFNTCSVREHAEHKIYSALGRLKYSKRNRPQKVIGVIGCMAQKDQELIFQKAPHVDLVVGTGQLAEIPRLIREARSSEQQSRLTALSLGRSDGSRLQVSDSFQSYDPLRDPEMRPTPFQAFVRIMIGCDKFCTYCVVPATRGPEQSRPPEHIIQEAKLLADQGVREITLLGQTVNSYKYTENGRLVRLSELLERLHNISGIQRIRFITSFPRDMTTDLLQAVRDLPKVMKYLHVPAQSGCNEVLRRMKRGYTVEDYREMMARINDIIPGCAVSSDFIVGFCGETDEAFEKSMQLIRDCRFKNSFIFKYSPRTGTKADELYPDDVPEEVKRRRNNEMLELQNRISEEDNAEFIGRKVGILVEGPSKSAARRAAREGLPADAAGTPPLHQLDHHDHHDERGALEHAGLAEPQQLQHSSPAAERLALQLTGRTECDRIVVFDGNPRLIGSLAEIEIHDCTSTTLIGSIVTRELQFGSGSILPILS
ncbi:tRNA-2-methylthio-N(6)-dimethylallyladenosine synthase [Planctomycetia bacterium]|nr:tRNA-2-methylthio-N(6)-dimethylallyladenosine synthase [Planctomycetia bacterium]